jgi:hypothetical protein
MRLVGECFLDGYYSSPASKVAVGTDACPMKLIAHGKNPSKTPAIFRPCALIRSDEYFH